ncbi:sulfur-oxidizing protein SoxA [Pseudoduganella flava]|uniref:SoxAX cytochrome complex subunit A n=1 Tax=Pseudoduganella flava TaxID=871742 RepID=A0A562PCF8_9BURK|nr:sulfur oxidation c-type cytochrome SoxA [Pseudoduganella flava]QGZ40149.1 sulfur oxidation c-type cytochrome SoxA [Pseudoduganella flava]TWI42099.1 sulfur-oxidizing protein SoxA [Pseudoduganella flava]
MSAPALPLLLMLAAALAQAQTQTQDRRKSGSEFMSESTWAMQRDDTQNPAMLWVANGEALWSTKAGKADKSCAACHGDAKTSMRGVAARYPAFDKAAGRVLNLGQRINQCRTGAQQAAPWKAESDELLALEAYVALQSRGMPVAPPNDAGTRAAAERGKRLFNTRIGQLNLSCAQCHDDHWGRKLAGATIPQGHANAYPIYRLEWQGMGSLQRRLRNCMNGVRAALPPPDAQDLVELEAWLALRAQGMTMESPGVRP